MEGKDTVKLLFIEACPRPEGVSRTRALARTFLDALTAARADVQIDRVDVGALRLAPLDGDALACREALIDARDWAHPMFAPARAFAQADALLIAAPYWDLMFPAMLKTYLEHIFVRALTFVYENDLPVGLCAATKAVFLTTAGSPMGSADFGVQYLRAVLQMLGIPDFAWVCAEGLDLADADVDGIMETARRHAAALAHTMATTR